MEARASRRQTALHRRGRIQAENASASKWFMASPAIDAALMP
jgi:hypothetical protein